MISEKFWNGPKHISASFHHNFLQIGVFRINDYKKSKYQSTLKNTEDALCTLGTTIKPRISYLCKSKHICHYM